MGADLIGWRGCELQREVGGEDGFLGKLKLRAYRGAIEAQVPPEARDSVEVSVVVHRPEGPVQRPLSYPEIVAELRAFEAGIPACASCPLSGGAPLGCYRYVTYPIDEPTERVLFEMIAAEVGTHGSAAQRFHEEVLSRMPSSGTGWHTRRGPDARTGALAAMAQPLVHTWGGWFSKKRLDSAQILCAIVSPPRDARALALYAELHARIAAIVAERRLDARGLGQLAELAPFYRALAEGAAREGWSVVVDS